MAILSQGFLGDASGKIGNVIFRRWKRKNVAQQYQPKVRNPKSPAQVLQRNRMKVVNQLLKPYKDVAVAIFGCNGKSGLPPWSQIVQANVKICSDPDTFSLSNLKIPGSKICYYKAPANLAHEVKYIPDIDSCQTEFNPEAFINNRVGLFMLLLENNNATGLQQPIFGPFFGWGICLSYDRGWEDDEYWAVGINFSGPGSAWLCAVGRQINEPEKSGVIGMTYQNNIVPVLPVEWPSTFNGLTDTIPGSAVTLSIEDVSGVKYLKATVDFSKCTIPDFTGTIINVWARGTNGDILVVYDNPILITDSNSFKFQINMGLVAGQFYFCFLPTGTGVGRPWRVFWDFSDKSVPFLKFINSFKTSARGLFADPVAEGFSGLYFDYADLFLDAWIANEMEKKYPHPPQQHILTINNSSSVSTISANGVVFSGSQSFTFDSGFECQLIVIPGVGESFAAWAGEDAASIIPGMEKLHSSIIMSKDMVIQATWESS